MTEEPDDFDRLLGSLAKEGRLQPDPDPEEHPDSGTLYAYHEGRLSPEQRSRVEEHSSLCGRCRDLLVEYRQFAEDPVEEGGPGERGRVADFGAAAEGRRLREQQRIVTREPEKPRRGWGTLGTAYSIAAALAVAVLGLSLYVANLRRELAEPKANSESYVLSEDKTSRSTEGGRKIKLIEGVPVTFTMPFPDADPQALYRLEVEHNGQQVFRLDGLKAQGTQDPIFRPTWPKGLKPGSYEFKLLEVREGSSEVVGQYSFMVEPR